ncbi:hypothetical protein Pmar_PMAR008479 [Perkinsus marinus ATCC 50983]|uniref:TLC domain-containing protein n=1 Tax=Perkinsus marinus (strain ATCC 50983 / TXsc) TaxID=423536 RepID=C5KFY5_PERM5|nr:hypothetical protein Pmar_PMAR008479 [Perkinsus marinus ATCC 50983]EER16608.1 hypothetical protein Pmar_PMAR008479 [Perkinsus marinus ATCC 50983]|eukprot:XP_002784812.1 hypothetical protein Pmar_PMAR008479 [Perkinsus marinus ATCC 50983]
MAVREVASYTIASFAVYVGIHAWKKDTKQVYNVTCLVTALVAVIMGVVCVFINREAVFTGAFNSNESLPLVVFLLAHNYGHLLYDLYHGMVWRPVVLPHHTVTLLSITASFLYDSGGLIIVIDSIITELGYLFLLIYYRYRTRRVYGVVIILYGSLRIVLLAWSYSVFQQTLALGVWSVQFLTVLGQVGIIIVAFHFLYRHCVNYTQAGRSRPSKFDVCTASALGDARGGSKATF